ncbi:MAG: cytochrome c oxidase subunit II [Gammaproteobacteria bacterium]
MNNLVGGLGAIGLTAGTSSALADYGLNMPRGVTPISHDIYDLHMLVLWICVAIGILVFGVMIYSIFYHRKSRGAVALNFHESTTVEIIWTTIPFVILVAIAVPATKTLLDLEDTRGAELTIKITGYQWKWKYDYLEDDISFFSNLATDRDEIENKVAKGENYLLEVDNPVVVPINKKIRFLTTSNDVIHSWWIPSLAVKQDAIPGFINDTWAEIKIPGVYRGQCAELCGKDHGFMPIVVIAKTESEYEEWVAAQKSGQAAEVAASEKAWNKDELMARGEKVYISSCSTCHQPTGLGIPGMFPAIAGSPVATGDVAGHINIVVIGKSGTTMQAFGEQLGDVDIAAVITYQRNAFGNDTGDMVQPSDIKAAR